MMQAITKAILALVALFALTVPAQAAGESVKVNLDQPFKVGATTLPAGEYSIRLLDTNSDTPILVFESSPASRIFVPAMRVGNDFDRADHTTELVFQSAEGSLSVKELRMAGLTYRYQILATH